MVYSVTIVCSCSQAQQTQRLCSHERLQQVAACNRARTSSALRAQQASRNRESIAGIFAVKIHEFLHSNTAEHPGCGIGRHCGCMRISRGGNFLAYSCHVRRHRHFACHAGQHAQEISCSAGPITARTWLGVSNNPQTVKAGAMIVIGIKRVGHKAVQQPVLELDHPARMAIRIIQVHLHSVLSVYAQTVTKQQRRKLVRTYVEAPLPVLPWCLMRVYLSHETLLHTSRRQVCKCNASLRPNCSSLHAVDLLHTSPAQHES